MEDEKNMLEEGLYCSCLERNARKRSQTEVVYGESMEYS